MDVSIRRGWRTPRKQYPLNQQDWRTYELTNQMGSQHCGGSWHDVPSLTKKLSPNDNHSKEKYSVLPSLTGYKLQRAHSTLNSSCPTENELTHFCGNNLPNTLSGDFVNLTGLLLISYGFPFWASMGVLCVSLSLCLGICFSCFFFVFPSSVFFSILLCFPLFVFLIYFLKRERKEAVELDGGEVG